MNFPLAGAMKRHSISLCLATLLLAANPAQAADAVAPPTQLEWTELLRIARDASPRLALSQQEIAMAEADRRSAGVFGNPSLSYTNDRPGGGDATLFDGRRAETFGIELPLPKFGLRGAKMRAADRGVEAARSEAQSRRNSLSADAGSAFIELLNYQQQVTLLQTANTELQRLRDVVAARSASGVASEYEVLRLDVELNAWQAKLAEANAQVAASQADLAVLLGYAGWQPIAQGGLDTVATQLSAFANASTLADHPALKAALAKEAAAKAEVSAAQRDRLPELSVSYEHNTTTGPYGASNALGLNIELPIGDSRRGPLERAKAEAASASIERELLQNELDTEVQRHLALASQRQQILDRFDAQVAQRLPQLQSMAEDAYRLGKSSITDLLDATRSRYEMQLEQSELQAQLAQARLLLAAARGQLVVAAP